MTAKGKSGRGRINENFIFIQAFSLFQQAQAEEKTSFIKALNLYKQTVSLIDSIPDKFPSSSLALKIAQRRFRLGKTTYSGIQKKIESLRLKASHEETLENSDQILAECSVHLARLEKFHSALQVQEAIKSDQTRDELLWKLAELKFRGDFFIEGIEIIRLIKNQDSRISRLIQLGVAIHSGKYQSETFKIYDFLPVAFSFWLEEKEKFETHSFQNKL